MREQPIPSNQEEEWLANLVAEKIIQDWEMQDQPEHLKTIQDRLLQSPNRTQLLTLYPTFRTLSCHREKLRREKIKVSIKINIRSEKRHLRNSKAPKMASKPILNKEQ